MPFTDFEFPICNAHKTLVISRLWDHGVTSSLVNVRFAMSLFQKTIVFSFTWGHHLAIYLIKVMLLVQNPILVVILGCSFTDTGVRHTCAIPIGHCAIPERRMWDPPSIPLVLLGVLLVTFWVSFWQPFWCLFGTPGSFLEDTLVRFWGAQIPRNGIWKFPILWQVV